MKKLMTMLAAVGMAFGLFAADAKFISGAGFDTSDTENPENGAYTWLMGDSTGDFVTGYWTGTEKASIVNEKYTYSGTHPAQFDDDTYREYDQYLKIESGTDLVSQRILSGSATQEIGDDGLYFDGLVQFTAFEDDVPAIDADAKIAVFPMVDDPDAETPVSHLIIKAFGTDTNLWMTTTVTDDLWHRVTIKMIKNINKKGTPQAGFVVFIDGNETPVVFDSEKVSPVFDDDDLTPEAAYYNKMNALFGSLIENTAEITDVAFGGKGAIDEIAFTENAPSFAGSPKFAWIKGAEHIASFAYSTETWEAGDDALIVQLPIGETTGTAAVSNIKAEDGYFVTTTAYDVDVTAGETNTVGEATALGATVQIEGQDDQYFETAAAALDYLNDAGEVTATLVLNAETSDAITVDNALLTLTLDLAGKTITQGENDAAAIVLTAGALKIIDSDGDGVVVGNGVEEQNTAILSADDGTLEIAGGTFDGLVAVIDVTISATTPKFDYAANQTEGACIINYTMSEELAGKVLVPDAEQNPTYWIVGTPVEYVAQINDGKKYETLEAALAEAEDGNTVKLLESITLADTLVIDKAITLEMNDEEITLAADKTVGINVTAAATIQNGDITSALAANVAGSKAINIPNKNVTITSVVIDAAHYEYAIYANCDDDCKAAGDKLEWFYTETTDKFATLNCTGVSISGNGSLFHVEGMVANLENCSATRDANALFDAAHHQAAVYSSCNSTTTIKGTGTYTHENALQSGNLGGKIFVNGGTFTGNIKSYMKVGAHPELEENIDYSALFIFDGGTYTGDIVFEDENARGLDSFTKKAGVVIAAPDGYFWKDDPMSVGYQSLMAIAATVEANGATTPTPFASASDALTEVQLLEQDEAHFPIGVTAVKDLEIVGPNGQTITLAAGGIIGITKDAWVITGTVAGEVTLVPGKSITVLATSTLKVNAPAGYKVVADTSVEGLVTYTVVEITYVAQIGDDPTKKFETLQEAFDAVTPNDTLNILGDINVGNNVLKFNFVTNGYAKTDKLTIVNNYTVTFNVTVAGSYNFYIDDADVTFQGTGTWAKPLYNGDQGSMIVSGKYGDGAAITIESGTFTGGDGSTGQNGPSNLIAAKKGSIVVNGGTIINKRALNGRCVRADGEGVTLTVNGGTFVNWSSTNVTFSNTALALPVANGDKDLTGTVVIPSTSTAKFNADVSRYVTEKGYGTVKGEDGMYAYGIVDYTVAVTDGTADKASYQIGAETQTVTLAPGQAAEGEEFDKWEVVATTERIEHDGSKWVNVVTTNENITVEGNVVTIPANEVGNIAATAQYKTIEYAVTFSTNKVDVAEAATTVKYGEMLKTEQIPSFEGGTWDVDPTTAVITCATNFNYTIAAQQPVNPGEEKSYDTEKEAEDAAKNINDHKDTMINVPATVPTEGKQAYLDRVEAKVNGTKVVVDIAADAEDDFQTELDTEIKKTTVAAALTDAEATEVTITTKAGFYYWIEGGVEVGTIKTNGDAVIGDGSTVELTKPALGTTTKAFYKLAVGVKDPASTPIE